MRTHRKRSANSRARGPSRATSKSQSPHARHTHQTRRTAKPLASKSNSDQISADRDRVVEDLRRQFTASTGAAADIELLGSGANGMVFRVSPTKVVKVTLASRADAKLPVYTNMQRQLCQQINSKSTHRAYRHFYVTSSFDHSHGILDDSGKPKYVYEEMVHMPMDLKQYATKNTTWGVRELIDIVCQIMHAARLFHRSGYILTDLKTGNVMIDPDSGRVRLIDFLDSYDMVAHMERDPTRKPLSGTNASRARSHTQSTEQGGSSSRSKNFSHTYFNRNNAVTNKEDVWRLGVLVVEMLVPYVNRILEQQGTPQNQHVDPECLRVMRRDIKNTKDLKPYSYDNMLAPAIERMQQVLLDSCPANSEEHQLWKSLLSKVVSMLDEDVDRRPSIRDLIRSRLFCTHCLVPRVDYSEDFGASVPKANCASEASQPLRAALSTPESGTPASETAHSHTSTHAEPELELSGAPRPAASRKRSTIQVEEWSPKRTFEWSTSQERAQRKRSVSSRRRSSRQTSHRATSASSNK